MQIWAYPNYRDGDIATIAIAIVIHYRDISHYWYYHSALHCMLQFKLNMS